MFIFASNPELLEAFGDPEFVRMMEENPSEMPVPAETLAMLMVMGFGVLACGFTSFVALSFGVIGLCQPGTRKIYPLLGVLFAGSPFLLWIGILVLGLIVGG